ncbi:type II secretory pathway, component PulF [Herbaspirillum sp. CF444]|uniref:type II secretion system F family protein n=1 Tax=Herbaspirillum sp. CF444 TaxID=1144319 RepID=UPI0002723FFB|nr:type II secretion system F family protein [Herbaspirillum sp. CF444]EJL90064.1 type II secretory pathway, component PulF [Herbaspirillum sp. CF444]
MQFQLKVYRVPEGVSSLTLSAADLVEATRQAEQQGYRVISAQRQLSLSLRLGKRQKFSVALFSQELLALLDAGLSLVETVDILARKSRDAEGKKILENLGRHLREGLSFSRALQAMPDAFPSLYVATIRTSEHTGDLNEALRRYLAYHRQLNLVRDKVVAASVYPVLLICVGMLVILFLLGYVVPRFSRVYEDIGGDLPWMSRVLMQWGHFLSDHVLGVMLGFFSLLAAIAYGLTRPATRAWLARTLWSLPTMGEKIRLYQLARFTRTLAMLINGGIPFVTALDMVADLLRQPALRDGLRYAALSISEGQQVSEAFSTNGLATDVGVRLLAVGERSGSMGESMERIAKLYDDEIARWVDWFTRLFEPLLMIAIGLIIGIVVLLMYLPIFELASSIQ